MRTDKELRALRADIKTAFKAQFNKELDDFHIRTNASKILQNKIDRYLYSRLEHLPIGDLMTFIVVAFDDDISIMEAADKALGPASYEADLTIGKVTDVVEQPKVRRGKRKTVAE